MESGPAINLSTTEWRFGAIAVGDHVDFSVYNRSELNDFGASARARYELTSPWPPTSTAHFLFPYSEIVQIILQMEGTADPAVAGGSLAIKGPTPPREISPKRMPPIFLL